MRTRDRPRQAIHVASTHGRLKNRRSAPFLSVVCAFLRCSSLLQHLHPGLSAGARTTQLYPPFYLAEDIDWKTPGKVTKCLRDLPGWTKWQFFTTPKASPGNITPLQPLARGHVERLESAASAFAER